jgi:hypothetical protein
VTILIAYDGSESADAAIAAAGKLLDRDRLDAVVLTSGNRSHFKTVQQRDGRFHWN